MQPDLVRIVLDLVRRRDVGNPVSDLVIPLARKEVLRLSVAGGQSSDQLSLFFEHRGNLTDPEVSEVGSSDSFGRHDRYGAQRIVH